MFCRAERRDSAIRLSCHCRVILILYITTDPEKYKILIPTCVDVGIRSYTLIWFSSYLQDHVVCSGSISSPHSLTTGVPEGWGLSPVLFSEYTHTMSSLMCSCGLFYCCYADDTLLLLVLCWWRYTAAMLMTLYFSFPPPMSQVSQKIHRRSLTAFLTSLPVWKYIIWNWIYAWPGFHHIYSCQSNPVACYVSSPNNLLHDFSRVKVLGPLLFLLDITLLNDQIISDCFFSFLFFITNDTQWFSFLWKILTCLSRIGWISHQKISIKQTS